MLDSCFRLTEPYIYVCLSCESFPVALLILKNTYNFTFVFTEMKLSKAPRREIDSLHLRIKLNFLHFVYN